MMGPFLAGAGAAQEALVARLASLKASFSSLDAYLGETSDAAEPEATLGRIRSFAASFHKACRDNERAAFLKKKAEEIEAERARKAEAEAKAAAEGADSANALPGGATPRKPQGMRRNITSPGLMMSSIQGSLRRGEYSKMKSLFAAAQAEMAEELKGKLGRRRQAIDEEEDD